MGVLLVAVPPSLCMLLGGVGASYFHVTHTTQARLQNMSAGILIGAIAEMLMELQEGASESVDGYPLLGIIIGFALSCAILFGLRWLMDSDDSSEEVSERSGMPLGSTEEEELCRRLEDIRGAGAVLGEKGDCSLLALQNFVFLLQEGTNFVKHHLGVNMKKMAPEQRSVLTQAMAQTTSAVERALRRVTSIGVSTSAQQSLEEQLEEWRCVVKTVSEKGTMGGSAVPSTAVNQRSAALSLVPWSAFAAVTVDAASDGFLLGIAYLASPNAAVLLSVGCSVEMGFLGWTFGSTLSQSIPILVRLVICFIFPTTLLFSCIGGVAIGEPLREYPTWFAGLTAFSVSSIIFLVTQELLPGAHANQKGHRKWHVDVMLFIGICGVLVMHSFLPETE